jgi:hypothetical protein
MLQKILYFYVSLLEISNYLVITFKISSMIMLLGPLNLGLDDILLVLFNERGAMGFFSKIINMVVEVGSHALS